METLKGIYKSARNSLYYQYLTVKQTLNLEKLKYCLVIACLAKATRDKPLPKPWLGAFQRLN